VKTTIIKNFVETHRLEASHDVHGTCGPLVRLSQQAGSMSFLFSMTPAQARELAKALTHHADALESAK
jgi:hypothetical protein